MLRPRTQLFYPETELALDKDDEDKREDFQPQMQKKTEDKNATVANEKIPSKKKEQLIPSKTTRRINSAKEKHTESKNNHRHSMLQELEEEELKEIFQRCLKTLKEKEHENNEKI